MTRSSWLLLAALTVACAGQPAWVLRPEQHGYGPRYVVAVGSASLSQGLDRARIVAEQGARAALAARVRTQVSAVTQDQMREQLDHGSGQVQSFETLQQDVRSTVDQTLEGVHTLEIYEDDTRQIVYALAALDLDDLRQRAMLWSAQIETGLSAQRRALRQAAERGDLPAVELAVAALQGMDTVPPGYARSLQAFDSAFVLPDTAVRGDITAALALLRSQWPQHTVMPVEGGVQIAVPAWPGASWFYELQPAGGSAQAARVEGARAWIALTRDSYTDDAGRVTVVLRPRTSLPDLGRQFVVQTDQIRPPEMQLQLTEAGCGPQAQAAMLAAAGRCLAGAGWRISTAADALPAAYDMSCGPVSTHDFGAGAISSLTASLRGGAEASGRAPVLDYTITAVASDAAALSTAAAERLAQRLCRELGVTEGRP